MRRLVRELETAVVCPLPQGFGFLPLTVALTRELRAKSISDGGLARMALTLAPRYSKTLAT